VSRVPPRPVADEPRRVDVGEGHAHEVAEGAEDAREVVDEGRVGGGVAVDLGDGDADEDLGRGDEEGGAGAGGGGAGRRGEGDGRVSEEVEKRLRGGSPTRRRARRRVGPAAVENAGGIGPSIFSLDSRSGIARRQHMWSASSTVLTGTSSPRAPSKSRVRSTSSSSADVTIALYAALLEKSEVASASRDVTSTSILARRRR